MHRPIAQRAERFRSLHTPGSPLLMPNAWDIGSAALFASLGFEAIATTSGGFAATRGRLDGAMTKDEVLAHGADLAGAVDIPVSADLENCFADDPEGVAATITAARVGWPAGRSRTSRATGTPRSTSWPRPPSGSGRRGGRPRGPVPFVLTARAENYLHGREDLADTIARLQAYQEAGADVLFAPRVVDPVDLRQLLSAVDRPVSVLVLPGAPAVGELAALGVSRISVGGAVTVGRLRRRHQRRHRAPRQGHGGLLGPGRRGASRDGRRLQSLTRPSPRSRPHRRGAARPRRWPSGCGARPRRKHRPAPCWPRPPRRAVDGSPARRRRSPSRSGLADPVEGPRASSRTARAFRAQTAAASVPSSTVTVSPRRPRHVSSPAIRGNCPDVRATPSCTTTASSGSWGG